MQGAGSTSRQDLRAVNQDLMGPSDGGDCGLPSKEDTRRFREVRFLPGMSCGWSASPCLKHPEARPNAERRRRQRVNHDRICSSDGGDCGLPLNGGTRRFHHGRFLHGLSDGWSASPRLRHAGGATVRRFGDDVSGRRADAKDSTRLLRESESVRHSLRFVLDLFCP